MFDISKGYISDLYLIFLSRQGYWSKEEKVDVKGLWKLIYNYLIVGLSIFLLMLSFRKQISFFLKNSMIFNFVSYFDIILYGLFLIIVFGIFYENYFTLKMETIETFLIFFRFSKNKIRKLLIVRNLIIIFPAIIFLVFYYPLLTLIIFLCVHFLSLRLIKFLLNLKKRRLKRYVYKNLRMSNYKVIRAYHLSTFGKPFILKSILVPIFSILFMIIMSRFLTSIFEINGLVEGFAFGFFLGTVFFQEKHLSYGFLALKTNFLFLKTLNINLKKYVYKVIFFYTILQLSVSILAFILLYGYFFSTDSLELLIIILGLILCYSHVDILQMRQTRFFEKIMFKNTTELEKYKIPIILNIPFFIYSGLCSILFMSIKLSAEKHQFKVLLFFMLIIFGYIIYQAKKLNQYLEEI